MNTYVRIRGISFYKIYVYVTKSYVFTCILRATTSKVIRRDRLTVETTCECPSRDRHSEKTLFVRRSARYIIPWHRDTTPRARGCLTFDVWRLTFDGLTRSRSDVITWAGVGFAAVTPLHPNTARPTHLHTTPRPRHATHTPALIP